MDNLVCVGLFLCKIAHCNQFSESQKTNAVESANVL